MSSCTCGSGYDLDICAEQAEAEKHPYYAQPSDENVDYGDGTALEVALRSADPPLVCGICGSATDAQATECPYCGYTFDEDGDPDPPAYLDPDALYDAAVDDAILAAIEDGRPAADWKDYMRGGSK